MHWEYDAECEVILVLARWFFFPGELDKPVIPCYRCRNEFYDHRLTEQSIKTLTADLKEGHEFINWTVDCTSRDKPCQVRRRIPVSVSLSLIRFHSHSQKFLFYYYSGQPCPALFSLVSNIKLFLTYNISLYLNNCIFSTDCLRVLF